MWKEIFFRGKKMSLFTFLGQARRERPEVASCVEPWSGIGENPEYGDVPTGQRVGKNWAVSRELNVKD